MLSSASRAFPLVVGPSQPSWRDCTELAPWVGRHRREVARALDAHGAVLLRGFRAAEDAYDFSLAMRALRLAPFESAESAAPRRLLAPHVYTANEAPASAVIPFHHEMAQCTTSPAVIAFFCECPASDGGATPFVSSAAVAAHVHRRCPAAATALATRGIRYVRTLPATTDATSPIGRSWRATYGATTRAEAEAALSPGCAWEWLADDALRVTSPPRPVFASDRRGRRTFFNSAVAARQGWADARNDPAQSVVFGDDGAPLDADAAALFDAAHDYMQSRATRLAWRAGDLLLLDNAQVLHARDPFVPPRRVLASLWGGAREKKGGA